MSMYISEMKDWLKNDTSAVQLGGGVKITGSLFLSESMSSGSIGNYISGSTGLQLTIGTTGSLALANPTAASLTTLFPNAVTGSLYMVGRAGQTWLAFKDLQGQWRTVTASFAA